MNYGERGKKEWQSQEVRSEGPQMLLS